MRGGDFVRRWKLVWVVPLLALLGFAAGIKELGRREQLARASFKAADARANAAGEAFLQHLRTLSDAHYVRGPNGGPGWTRADLERELNGGAPLPMQPFVTNWGQPRDKVLLFHPASGWTFEFSFEDGRWMGLGTGQAVPVRTPPRPHPLVTAWFPVRKLILPLGGGTWLLLLLAGVLLSRWRFHLDLLRASLFAAAAVALLAQAHPYGTWLSTSNDYLMMGLFMAAVSATFLAVARGDQRGRDRQTAGVVCLNCGYDLRATPERCPECGTRVPGGAAAGAAAAPAAGGNASGAAV